MTLNDQPAPEVEGSPESASEPGTTLAELLMRYRTQRQEVAEAYEFWIYLRLLEREAQEAYLSQLEHFDEVENDLDAAMEAHVTG